MRSTNSAQLNVRSSGPGDAPDVRANRMRSPVSDQRSSADRNRECADQPLPPFPAVAHRSTRGAGIVEPFGNGGRAPAGPGGAPSARSAVRGRVAVGRVDRGLRPAVGRRARATREPSRAEVDAPGAPTEFDRPRTTAAGMGTRSPEDVPGSGAAAAVELVRSGGRHTGPANARGQRTGRSCQRTLTPCGYEHGSTTRLVLDASRSIASTPRRRGRRCDSPGCHTTLGRSRPDVSRPPCAANRRASSCRPSGPCSTVYANSGRVSRRPPVAPR